MRRNALRLLRLTMLIAPYGAVTQMKFWGVMLTQMKKYAWLLTGAVMTLFIGPGFDLDGGLRCGPPIAAAAEIAGVKLQDNIQLDGRTLRLNGAALRRWGPARLYVIGLYLDAERQPVTSALAAPVALEQVTGAKRISLTLLRDLTARQLSDALHEGIRDNHSSTEFNRLLPRMERLSRVMTEVGSARSGSRLHIDFLPPDGTRVALDDRYKGETIEGEDFYLAIMRIWLGSRPPDPALKEALLGSGFTLGTR